MQGRECGSRIWKQDDDNHTHKIPPGYMGGHPSLASALLLSSLLTYLLTADTVTTVCGDRRTAAPTLPIAIRMRLRERRGRAAGAGSDATRSAHVMAHVPPCAVEPREMRTSSHHITHHPGLGN